MRDDCREFWRLVHLANVLDMRDPLDQTIFNSVKDDRLSFEFVSVSGGR